MSLASVYDLAAFLHRDIDADEWESALLKLELASGIVEAHCGRRLTRTEEAETVEFTVYGGMVFLPSPPVDVSAVTVDDTAVDFTFHADEGVVHINRADGTKATVTFQSGPETVPAVAKAVTLAIASRLTTNADGVTQKSIGDVSISYGRAQAGPGLTEWEAQALTTLRVPSVR